MDKDEDFDSSAPNAAFAWGNFHKIVIYGWSHWPSYCEWIVPGTITDEERF